MAIDDVLRGIGSTLTAFALPLGVAAAASIIGSYLIGGVWVERGQMRKSVKMIAPYMGVAPEQISPTRASELAEKVLPHNNVVSVPVNIPKGEPLGPELQAYYRHPNGVGSDEALSDFFKQQNVVSYLQRPRTLSERLIFA